MNHIFKVLYFQDEDFNIILLDWSRLASTWWYSWVVGYTKDVAKIAARLIEFLNNNNLTSPENVHFIGKLSLSDLILV